MSLVGERLEHVQDAGLDAQRRVAPDAHALRDAIGDDEADPRHVARQPVRIVAHPRHRLVAVRLADARGVGERDAEALQEDHDLALLPPSERVARCSLGAPLADPLDLRGAPRLLLDHLDRLGAERADEPLGQHRTDALERLEVARHAALRCAEPRRRRGWREIARRASDGAPSVPSSLSSSPAVDSASGPTTLTGSSRPATCRRRTANEPSGAVNTTRRTLPSSVSVTAIANMNSLSTPCGRSCVIERKKMTTTSDPALGAGVGLAATARAVAAGGPRSRGHRLAHRRDAARRRGSDRLRAPHVAREGARRRRHASTASGRSSAPTPSSICPTASRASSASRSRPRPRA